MSRPGSGMVEARRPWYLLTGLVVGLALGLVFAWVIYPVKYVDTAPQALRADFKARYRSLVAQAYAASGDLGRARARLALLGDADAMAALAAQAQQIVAAGGSQPEARSLALLASALGKPEGALLTEQPTALQPSPVSSETPTLTSTSTPVKSSPTATAAVTTTRRAGTATRGPSPTITPTGLLPSLTHTPTATPGAPFVLQDRQEICDASLPEALLQIYLEDASGQPVPGVIIRITWDSGQDYFFSGLKPEIGLGYADFSLTPGTSYALRVGEAGQVIADLQAPECTGGKIGGLKLTFRQP